MADPVNPIDYATETLAVFLAKTVSDGTYADVIQTLKTDQPGQETAATGISTSAGQLIGNLIDDFFLASYDLLRAVALGALGDVTGPASATDNALARFDTTTGKLIQNSIVIVTDLGEMTGVKDITTTGRILVGTDVALTSASPSLSVGGGTGSPDAALNKVAGGESELGWFKAGVVNWAFTDDTGDDLILTKQGGASVMRFNQSTGLAFFSAAIQVTDLATFDADAILDSADPDLIVGDGTGSPRGIYNKVAAGTSRTMFAVAGVQQFEIVNTATAHDLAFNRAGGATVLTLAQADGLATFAGGTTWGSGSPVIRLGDGTGSPTQTINKSETGTGALNFRKLGVNSFELIHDSNEDFAIRRAGGVQVLKISQSSGLATWAGNSTWGSASPVVRVGLGTGSPTQTMNKSGGGLSAFNFQVASVNSFEIVHNSVEDLLFKRSGATLVLTLSQSSGNATFAANVILDSASPQVKVGDATGSPLLILNKDTTGEARLIFQNESTQDWELAHDSAENFAIRRAGGVAVLTLAQSTGNATWAADLTLDSASPDILLGDATGSPRVILNKDTTGAGAIIWRNEGAQSWSWTNNSSEDFVLAKGAAAAVLTLNQSTSLATWAASMDLDSASPTLTVGDNSGSPTIIVDKTETGVGTLEFRKASTQSYSITHNALEDLVIARASGTTVVTFNQAAGRALFAGEVRVQGDLRLDGTNLGFYGTAPIAKPTVTGSRGGNAALASLLTQLANLGLLTDSSS